MSPILLSNSASYNFWLSGKFYLHFYFWIQLEVGEIFLVFPIGNNFLLYYHMFKGHPHVKSDHFGMDQLNHELSKFTVDYNGDFNVMIGAADRINCTGNSWDDQ